MNNTKFLASIMDFCVTKKTQTQQISSQNDNFLSSSYLSLTDNSQSITKVGEFEISAFFKLLKMTPGQREIVHCKQQK